MADYIEKDELLKFKADVYDEDGHLLYAVPTGCIVAMPLADVVQVVHGRWVLLDECYNEGVYCSACQKKVYKTCYANQKIKSKFCPNCGARME